MKFKKGQIPWNKGITGTSSHMYGRKHTLGLTAWNKGKKLDYSVWNKGVSGYTTSKKGFKHTEEFGNKISKTRKLKIKAGEIKIWNEGLEGFKSGKDHYNWKGGKGTLRHQEMGRLKYIEWRSFVFQRDNYTCQKCTAKGVYLMAHHKKSWANYPELRYDISNGITLCKKCHASVDKYYAKFYEGRILS